MSLAAAVDIINRSKVLDFRVDIRCAAVWDWALENNKQTMATQWLHRVDLIASFSMLHHVILSIQVRVF